MYFLNGSRDVKGRGEFLMFGKMVLASTLALTLGVTAFAATDLGKSVEVTVKGVMQEDKGGMFIVADGEYYDLVFGDDSSADMKKFHSGLEGDMVRVKGNLIVDRTKDGKVRLVVLTNDVARLKGERAPEIKYEPRVVEERPVFIERERSRGINLPGVHINW
jgi:hypothetical protein